jgi:hypothetical protein
MCALAGEPYACHHSDVSEGIQRVLICMDQGSDTPDTSGPLVIQSGCKRPHKNSLEIANSGYTFPRWLSLKLTGQSLTAELPRSSSPN